MTDMMNSTTVHNSALGLEIELSWKLRHAFMKKASTGERESVPVGTSKNRVLLHSHQVSLHPTHSIARQRNLRYYPGRELCAEQGVIGRFEV